MEPLRYKSKARVIAYTDLMMKSILVLRPLILCILASVANLILNDNPKALQAVHSAIGFGNNSLPIRDFLDFLNMCIGLLGLIFVVTIQLSSAIALTTATQVEMKLVEVSMVAEVWRNLTIFFTAGMVFVFTFTDDVALLLILAGNIAFNCIGIYIVHKFMVELNLVTQLQMSTEIRSVQHEVVSMKSGMSDSPKTQSDQGLNFQKPDIVVKK